MKKKNLVTLVLIAVFFFGLTFWNLLGEKTDYSESERRVLAQFPKVTTERIMSGQFAEEFEEYAVDCFPMRDVWRRMKAYIRTGLFAQKDNHDIYTANGHISKMEYPMNTEMVDYALELFQKVQQTYLDRNKIYFAVIPDKNHYLAEPNGYLSLDYEAFTTYVKDGMDFAKYIEIADLLDADDYYFTDTHWRQNKIVDVAERIATGMGAEFSANFTEEQLEIPFEGVYIGQSALVHEPDVITYLKNDVLNRVTVEGADAVYDLEKAKGRDAYEMFLSGNQPIVKMRDEENRIGKRLIVFRDSFGSCIAPLLMAGYSEIVLVDLRYISGDMLAQYVNFEGADVLFLYSTLMLNNSLGMK